MVVELGLESTVRPRGRPAQQRVLAAAEVTERLPFESTSDQGRRCDKVIRNVPYGFPMVSS